MRTLGFVCSLLFALAAGFLQPRPAAALGAEDAPRWGIVPVPHSDPAVTDKGYFLYTMQPHGQGNGQVLLRNPGAEPVTVELTAVAGETAQMGGSAFATGDSSTSGSASWITLSQSQVTVAPGMEQAVSFAVNAPAGAKPGQYLAGIAAAEAPPAASAAAERAEGIGASITLKTRYVIAVQTDIAGAWNAALNIPGVELLDQPSGSYVGVHLDNTGDTLLKPSGSVVVTDAAGAQIVDRKIEMGTFVPATSVTFPIPWPGKPAAGTYKVSVKLGYGDGKTATYDSSFVVSAAAEQHAVERAAAQQSQGTAQASPAAASAIQPWMIYGIAGLLILMSILLALNLWRVSSGRKPR